MPVDEQEKAAKARDAALKGALSQIEREFGKGTVMRMGDEGAQVRVECFVGSGSHQPQQISRRAGSPAAARARPHPSAPSAAGPRSPS